MAANRKARRPDGTGALFEHRGAWYGQWRVGGRLVKRKLGPKRAPGSRGYLTRSQAEARLRILRQEVQVPSSQERLTVGEAGEAYVAHVENVRGRRPTTVADYRSILRRHLAPFFGRTAIDRVSPDRISAYMRAKSIDGLAPKTVSNHLNFAHGLFSFAVKQGWAAANPVAAVERPRSQGPNPDIRYLGREEVGATIAAVPDDTLGPTDRVLYAVAAGTGLRQGELIALRWIDVDWAAGLVRVRRSITRGRLGPPKSRRASRAVPLSDRLAGELERHFQRSFYQADTDLVLCHPETGRPYDPSRMRKRFKVALRAAGARPVRFHDLRHSFGTAMAGVGVPMRTLQEWMGHRDFKTTLIYADYAPSHERERRWAELAFGDPPRPFATDDRGLQPEDELGDAA